MVKKQTVDYAKELTEIARVRLQDAVNELFNGIFCYECGNEGITFRQILDDLTNQHNSELKALRSEIRTLKKKLASEIGRNEFESRYGIKAPDG